MNVAKLHRHRLFEVVRAVVPWFSPGFVPMFGVVSIIMTIICAVPVLAQSEGHGAAEDTGGEQSVQMVIAGQALIKIDPRTIWPHPFKSIRPVIESADVGFTNFEMAVNPPSKGCGVPKDYVTITGEPAIGHDRRPGNTGGPTVTNYTLNYPVGCPNNGVHLSLSKNPPDYCSSRAGNEYLDRFLVRHGFLDAFHSDDHQGD